MNKEYMKDKYTFQDLVDIVHRLRQPDGCPWDSTQTYESMRKCVTDEAAEVVEAVDNNDIINLKEELGDLLLQVLLYSDIAGERGDFTLEDVIDMLSKKMINRHPHVFEDEESISMQYGDVMNKGVSLWNAIKLKEKRDKLKEYELMYEEGKISLDLLELKKEKYLQFCERIKL